MRGIFAATGMLLLSCGAVLAEENTAGGGILPSPSIWQSRLNPLRSNGEPAPAARPQPDTRTPMQRLRDQLEGSDKFQAIAAAEELRRLGSAGASVLIDAITGDRVDGSARFSVHRVLSEMGPELGPALEELIRGPREKWLSLGIMTEPLKLHAPRLVPLLAEVIRDQSADPEHKLMAITWLMEMGPAGARAADAVVQFFRYSEDDENRMEALRALALMGPLPNQDTVPVLQCLLDENQMSELRILAAHVLVRQRSFSTSVIPAVIGLIEDDLAKEVLTQLGTKVIPPLDALLQDENAPLEKRIAGVKTLGRIGPDATTTLVTTIGQHDELDAEISQALLQIGPRHAIPRIYQVLRESDTINQQPLSLDQRNRNERLQEMIVMLSSELGGWGGGDAPAMAAPTGESGGGSGGLANMLSSPAPESPSGAPAAAADPDSHFPAIGAHARATSSDSAAKTAPPTPDSDLKLVKVFYATNRKPLDSIYQRRTVEWRAFLPTIIFGSVTMLLSAFGFALSRSPRKAALAGIGFVITLVLAYPATQRTVDLENSAANRPGPVYGGETNNDVHLGTCEVTIPGTHQFGELESASLYKLEMEHDPRKHIAVRSVCRKDQESFYVELKQNLAERGSHIMVFVHGYNVSFDDAARRTAQMAYDLKFGGAPIFFSWPSQGNWYEYREDEKQVELAVNPLKAFLLDVTKRSGANAIHLVAHSMGNRALTEALREIEAEAEQSTLFNQVVLAAPDIDAQVFRDRIAPAITSKAQRVTLYASSNDLALLASRTFNSGDFRAGDVSGDVLVVPGIETIDVSLVDSSLLGHSYYGSNPTVLTDLKELLHSTRSAAERESLEQVSSAAFPYWIFRYPKIASVPVSELSK